MIYFICFLTWIAGIGTAPMVFAETQNQKLEEAQTALEAGEYYKARQMAQEVLNQVPGDQEAEKLMAEIIDREIEREKIVFEVKADEEFTDEEKSEAVKTWLERSQALFNVRQYEEAVLAAEKVFIYDSQNLKASQLIDKIKRKASDEGRAESVAMRQMYEGEIQDRIARYREQSKQWMESGQWGAARLAVEKILLLEPEDREALALYEKIKEHRKSQTLETQRNETGKTL